MADAKFMKGVARIALAIAAASGLVAAAAQEPPADIVIRGGTIYPGNAAPFRGDIAIRADRIVYVGPKAPGGAKKVINATGMIVAPGFIDPHTHADEALASRDPTARLVLPFLMQGVTTAFIGVDGHGDTHIARTLGRTANEETTAGSPSALSERDVGINFAS
jgi:N-acyl-D-amino-acid deacylase